MQSENLIQIFAANGWQVKSNQSGEIVFIHPRLVSLRYIIAMSIFCTAFLVITIFLGVLPLVENDSNTEIGNVFWQLVIAFLPSALLISIIFSISILSLIAATKPAKMTLTVHNDTMVIRDSNHEYVVESPQSIISLAETEKGVSLSKGAALWLLLSGIWCMSSLLAAFLVSFLIS